MVMGCGSGVPSGIRVPGGCCVPFWCTSTVSVVVVVSGSPKKWRDVLLFRVDTRPARPARAATLATQPLGAEVILGSGPKGAEGGASTSLADSGPAEGTVKVTAAMQLPAANARG